MQICLWAKCNVYVKAETYAVCLHKSSGRMGDEGKKIEFKPETRVIAVIEATFIVG